MDDPVINFDQLQDEINEAERYLREEVLRTKTQGYGRSFRSSRDSGKDSSRDRDSKDRDSKDRDSKDRDREHGSARAGRSGGDPRGPASSTSFETPRSELSTSGSTKKYASADSREKLLNRLMVEHGSKHSTPVSSRSGASTHFSSHVGSSGYHVSNTEEPNTSRLVASVGSRSSSPALSSKATPGFHDSSSGGSIGADTPGDTYDAGNEDAAFFKTIKKYSDGESNEKFNDETLFFASDVVSPSLHSSPMPKEPSQHMLSHVDREGNMLSTLYKGNDEGELFASHFLHPASPTPGATHPSRRGASASPGRRSQRDFGTTTKPAARPQSATIRRMNESGSSSNDVPGEGSQKKYLKTKKEVIANAENDFKRQHTFKPQLEFNNKKKGHQQGSVDRIDAMIQVHGQSLANRERQKIELERAKVEANCSFKPTLSKGTQQIMRQKAKETGVDNLQPSERLFQQAGKHQVQKRMLKHQVDEAIHSECTFKPNLNPNSSAILGDGAEQRPLYERVGDVQRQHAMKRQVLLECYEEANNEHLTRNPAINDKSRDMVTKRRSQADSTDLAQSETRDVGSRLMNEARNQLNRKYRLIEERERELASKVKNPALCRGSQRYVSNNPNIRNASFIKRQEDHAKKVTINVSECRRKDDVESNRWFKPDITAKTNDILQESRPEVIEETPEQRAMRLYRDDVEDIDRKRRLIEEEMYGNISFVPSIDPISKELGRSSGMKELSENKRGQRLKSKVKQTYEQRESEVCTFQPQIAQSQKSYLKELYASGKMQAGPNLFAPHMAWEDVGCPVHPESSQMSDVGKPMGSINMREPERMAREIRLQQLEKDEKRRSELIVREIDELQECSFQPKIYRKPAGKSTKPVVVAGVGRHLELKYMKQKQDELAKERAENAFRVKNVEHFRRKADGATIVEPFRMAESTRRKSRAAAELEENDRSNMTFHPVTKDYERRMAAKLVMEKSTASY